MRSAAWIWAFLLLVPAVAIGGEQPTGEAQVVRELLVLHAPLADWEPISKATRRPGPTGEERALSAFAYAPEEVGRYVHALPDTPEMIARVMALYEAELRQPTWRKQWTENVHDWLMANTDEYKADLISA